MRDAYRELYRDSEAFFVRYGIWWGFILLLQIQRARLETMGLTGVSQEIVATILSLLDGLTGIGFGIDFVRQRLAGETLRLKALSVHNPRLWRSLGLMAATTLPMYAVAIYDAAESGKDATIFLLLAPVAIAWVMVCTTRWFVAYPKIALDLPGSTLRASWRLTRGNAWRLGVVLMLVLVPLLIGKALLSLAVFYLPNWQIPLLDVSLFSMLSAALFSVLCFAAEAAYCIVTVNVYLLLSGGVAAIPASRSET